MSRGVWIFKSVVFCIVLLVLIGLVTQYLWNWLVPVLFAGPVITFWQALGLLLLSKIFLWTFSKHGNHNHGPWRHYWKHKLSKMTPEERDEIKKKMRDRWCPKERETPAGE